MEPGKQENYNAAVYARLSREDSRSGESLSIEHQKEFLERFIREQGWTLSGVYTDDGYSGTSFDRPGLNQMISDAESGKINLVVVKDGCVNIELNSESPQKCGFCDVSSVF